MPGMVRIENAQSFHEARQLRRPSDWLRPPDVMRNLDDGLRAAENPSRVIEQAHLREEFRWEDFQACRSVRILQRNERVSA